MPDALDTWFASCIVAGLVYGVAWAVAWSIPAIVTRRNDVADIAWGLVFPMYCIFAGDGLLVAFDPEYRRSLVALLFVSAWGVRLAWHIGARTLTSVDEDRRYAAWRRSWGPRIGVVRLRSFLQVFLMQVFVALLVVQPVLIAVAVPAEAGGMPIDVLTVVGLAIATIGVSIEAIADGQLRRFLKRRADDPGSVGRFLDTGLWAWSRHPNYFGDAVMWTGLGVVGVGAAMQSGEPLLLIPAIAGPVAMACILRFGTGVRLAESVRAGDPAWAGLVERVPGAFVPRVPVRKQSSGEERRRP